ncbi:MAG: hypothetical protein ACK52I_32185 [Pseudomonadota bacterium]|jgi:hypothetical protein
MIKKFLTTVGMFVSSASFSQSTTTQVPLSFDPEMAAQIEAEIQQACGHLVQDEALYKECVAIVTMDFTVIPHNMTNSGGCPGSCDTYLQ